ncbi:protein-L-isoaspartate(D-aspartate) O-methyltransferase [Wenjunlia vitaminophila]|uniref:Protein-L-isoaspartate O-methyltransferase n=1 Tax=Wenjunlia vitaminophila TaxID=76728 RepID=A0A0T6LRI3_WENVI|nr:protein-L-isoaspartate(D-aspartate) O-methyltransferase [Wenjunlia vitaminophila]
MRGQVRPGWEELGRHLLDTGTMTADWAASFAATPRAGFLPGLMWPHDPATGRSFPVDRGSDPEAWWRWAESDVPVVTQWDDGRHSGDGPGEVPTSSASMPSVVLAMLRNLDVRDGMDVLEVGTGTGWNAALLSHRLGAERVVTVEVDPGVAATARGRLRDAGRAPQVVCADGLAGWSDRSPYDRVVATCGVRSVPAAWVRQTRPGGLVVAPWGTAFSSGDALVRLCVAEDGETASGRFTGPVEFMKARSQRLAWPRHGEYVTGGSFAAADRSVPALAPVALAAGTFAPVTFAIGLQVRECAHTVHAPGDGATTVWLYSLAGDRSWAAAVHPPGGEPVVYQHGVRRLWDEVEEAHHWWARNGRPGFERFGLTVTPEAQTAWLDSPDRPVPVSGPGPALAHRPAVPGPGAAVPRRRR